MTLVYAAAADWDAAGYGIEPANLTRLLASASILVTDATAGDIYDVDDTGLPTDADKLAAFKAATLAQAAAWDAVNYDPVAGGVATVGTVVSKTLDGAGVGYADGKQAATARAAAANQLVPEAVRILKLAQLATTRTWEFG